MSENTPRSEATPWTPMLQAFPFSKVTIHEYGGKGLDDAAKEELHSIFDKVAKELGYDLSQPMHSEYNRRIPMVRARREYLRRNEEKFKSLYSYGTIEARHCLTSLCDDAFYWMDNSSGIMWVGVCGMNDICVVTLSGHVDWKRVHGGLAYAKPETVLSLFRKCVLSELDDLADPSSERCTKSHRSFGVPFCVVSATPGATETPNKSWNETSSVGYAAEAIDFVRSSGLLPNVQDSGSSVQLAISAFERLIQKKCEAKEIGVTVFSGRRHGFPSVKDLDIFEIGDNLATIVEKTGL